MKALIFIKPKGLRLILAKTGPLKKARVGKHSNVGIQHKLKNGYQRKHYPGGYLLIIIL